MPSLPLEVIIMIIQKADYESAINWTLATEGDSFLHKEALAHRWAETYICAADLAAAPGEYEFVNGEYKAARREYEDYEEDYNDDEGASEFEIRYQALKHSRIVACGKLGKANRDPQSKLNQAARAAEYIRHLYFDLRPSDIQYPGAYPPGYDAVEPTYETAEYSAQTLLPHVTKLDSLVLDGCLSEGILAVVPACRHLTVRPNFIEHSFRWGEFYTGFTHGGYHLKWEMELPRLETLVVGQLDFSDSLGLSNFIGRLTSLRTLQVSVSFPGTEFLEELYGRDAMGPLHAVLLYLSPEDSRELIETDLSSAGGLLSRLPPSLRSLKLVDDYYLGYKRARVQSKPSSFTPAVALEELHTQLDDIASTSNILTWMPASRLQRLSISAGCKDLETDCFHVINRTVSTHQETLHEIIFTNVWYANTDLTDRFNMAWVGRFAITDLVLGMTDYQAYSQDESCLDYCDHGFSDDPEEDLSDNQDDGLSNDKDDAFDNGPNYVLARGVSNDRVHSEGIRKMKLSSYLFGHHSHVPMRWGQKLERLALEAFNIRRWRVDGIQHPDLSALRVLILCPRGRDLEKEYPTPLSNYPAGMLALKITKLGPSTLRYLVVGKDSFWINDQRDIIYIADAGPDERGEIFAWMNEHDKAFIDPDSRINAPRKGRIIETFEPDYALVTEWNFMVARRVSGVESR